MIIAYELSMPSNNAWNNRWSGEDDCYVIVRTYRGGWPTDDASGMPLPVSNRYAFGDGWVAAVRLRKVDSREARQLRKRSQGFCGYDWMVDSLLQRGDIRASVRP